MTVGHINKLQDGQVVIVASVTKFTDNVDFNWGYCFATNSFKSEIFPLDTDDFWMAKLQAIDEVIHRFSEPTVFFIRGVRFCASVYNIVGYKRKPALDELCLRIRQRLVDTKSKLFPILSGSEQWHLHNKINEELFTSLNPGGKQKVREIDYELKEKAGNGTNQYR